MTKMEEGFDLQEKWVWQREKMLSWLRVGVALAAIFVVQLNPERMAKFPILSHVSLVSFFIYSLVVAGFARRKPSAAKTIGLVTTFLDLLWVSLIVLSTGAPQTPFFVYYSFPVITASSRYGVKGSLAVAVTGVVLYGVIRFSFFWSTPITPDRFIIRIVYLLMLAYIFGFLSDFEKRQNQRLVLLSKTATDAAVQEERRRIARELHDRLLQVLASLTLRLEACRKHFIGKPTELARELELIEKAARGSMRDIRTFLAGKQFDHLAPGTFLERLKEEMEFIRDGVGIRVIFEVEPDELTLSQEVEQEMYPVLIEGLMNIARHSQASRLTLSLKQTEKELSGSLEDNGVGFDPGAGSDRVNYGLRSMRERIEKLRGCFSIQTAPGEGTALHFTVPLA